MEAQAQAICMATNDFRRAFEAFAAKRQPEFKAIDGGPELPRLAVLRRSHRRLAEELESWCQAELSDVHGSDIDAECRTLVRKLGSGGWLRYCVPAAYGGVHECSMSARWR
jgi:alkylation response protein AidB-like acyl-CoA dehydrogenase